MHPSIIIGIPALYGFETLIAKRAWLVPDSEKDRHMQATDGRNNLWQLVGDGGIGVLGRGTWDVDVVVVAGHFGLW